MVESSLKPPRAIVSCPVFVCREAKRRAHRFDVADANPQRTMHFWVIRRHWTLVSLTVDEGAVRNSPGFRDRPGGEHHWCPASDPATPHACLRRGASPRTGRDRAGTAQSRSQPVGLYHQLRSEWREQVQTFADRAASQQPRVLANARFMDACVIVGGSLLMALCAHVSIPLWFTPVPITLQTFGVILLALTLGGRRAAAAMVLYLIEGASGFPVFSPHGSGGAAQLVGPTGGFLLAYPFAAFFGGVIAQNWLHRTRFLGFAAGAIATEFIIFLFGATWLGFLSHQPMRAILIAAVFPFIPGEVLKATAAIALALGKRERAAQA